MRRYKSLVSVLLCVLLLVTQMPVVNMQSDDIHWLQTGSKEITITGKTMWYDEVTVNILPAGKTYEDLANTQDPHEVVVYQNQTTADVEGNFIFTVGFKEHGHYTAYVRRGSGTIDTLSIICSADWVPADPEYIFNLDFEDGQTVEDGGLYLNNQYGTQNGKNVYHQYDEEHGTSLRMDLNLWGGSVAKMFDKPIQEGVYALQFSYVNETQGLGFVRLADGSVETVSDCYANGGRCSNTLYTGGGEVSVYNNVKTWEKPTDPNLIHKENEGGWNDVLIVIDHRHNEVTYALNGKHILTRAIPSNGAVVLGGLGITFNPASGYAWLDDIRMFELKDAKAEGIVESAFAPELWAELASPVGIDFESGKIGNIFGGSDKTAFDVTFTEKHGISDSFTVDYTVYDESDTIVWSGTDAFDLSANAATVRRLELPVTKFGLYHLTAKVTGRYHKAWETFTKFSKVNFPAKEFENEDFGTCMHNRMGSTAQTADMLELADMMGAGVIRDELAYSYMTINEDGTYSFPERDVQFWLDMKERGMKFLFCLNYGIDTSIEYGSEEYCALYKEWAIGVATYFKELGLDFVIETTNEWNHKDKYTAAQYYPVQKAMYEGIKSVDENILVLGGCVAHAYWHQLTPLFELMNGEKIFDVFSMHIYSNYAEHGPEAHLQKDQIETCRAILDTYGYNDIPIWVSETGWCSPDTWATDRLQGAYLARTMALEDVKDNWWDVVTWYGFVNKGTSNLSNEDNFGMLEGRNGKWENPVSLAAKPAYLTFSNFNTILGDAAYQDTLTLADDVYAYRYEKEDGKKVIFLTAETDTNVFLPIGEAQAMVYDMYGNGTLTATTDGKLDIVASAEPQYIEYSTNAMYQYIYTDSKYITRQLPMSWADHNAEPRRLTATHFFDKVTGSYDLMYSYVVREEKGGWSNYGGAQYTRGAQMKLDGVTGAVAMSWDMYARNVVRGSLNVTINTTGESDWSTTDRKDADGIYLLASDNTNLHLGHATLSDDEKALWNVGSMPLDTGGTWQHFVLVADVANQRIILYRDGKVVLSGAMPEGVDAIYGLSMSLYNAKSDGNWGVNPAEATAVDIADNPELVLRDYTLYEVPAAELSLGFNVTDMAISKGTAKLESLEGIAVGDTLTASAHIENFTNDYVDAVMLFALYNGDVMTGIRPVPVGLYPGFGDDISAELTVTDTTDLKAKLFIWKWAGTDIFSPLADLMEL